jgi:serine O-acetyltransferase
MPSLTNDPPHLASVIWRLLVPIWITKRGRSATAMLIVELMDVIKRGRGLWRSAALVHLERMLRSRYGCFISRHATISPSCRFPHPVGIVIGEGAVVGERCVIYQHVTLGGRRIGDWQKGLYPTVGNDVVVFAGAALLGAISIGDGATIGANAVVLKDVPPGAAAVGVPARMIESPTESANA